MTDVFLLACDELIFLAHRFVVAEEEGKAREAICKLPDAYLDVYLVPRAMANDDLAVAVARLILCFQITDFKLLKPQSTLRN